MMGSTGSDSRLVERTTLHQSTLWAGIHDLKPNANDAGVVADVDPLRGVVGPVPFTPVFDRSKVFSLGFCELPRDIGETMGLNASDLDDCDDLPSLTKERLPFADLLDGLAFIQVILSPESGGRDLSTFEHSTIEALTHGPRRAEFERPQASGARGHMLVTIARQEAARNPFAGSSRFSGV